VGESTPVASGLAIYDYAMFAYFAAFVAYAAHAFFARQRWVSYACVVMLLAAAALHTVFFVQRAIFYNHQHQGFVLPATNMFEAISFFAWLTVLSYLILEPLLFKTRRFGVFALIIPAAAMAYTAKGINQDPRELMPSLKSYWLVFHVTTMFVSYALLALAFMFALLYILRSRRMRLDAIDTRYNLRYLDEISYKLVLFSFPVLTLGIFLGAVWADQAWGRYWGWDPKEVWALITCLLYLAYLHLRVQRGWIGYRSALMNIIGFVAVLITFIGVNLLDEAFKLNSIHAYAEGGGTFFLMLLGLCVLIPVIMYFLPMPDEKQLRDEHEMLEDSTPSDEESS
jgi:cytochrome c-type biogenesis protein CcsB